MNRRARFLALAALGLLGVIRPLAGQDSLRTRARHMAASGEFREAASAWRLVLDSRPDDLFALAGLVDALEAMGAWRDAIAPLDRLLALGVSDPARLRQRGFFAIWGGDRRQGVDLLRRAVAQNPRDPASHAALAQVLSWSPATRGEAARSFAEALRLGSTSDDVLVAYADLLSWNRDNRGSAEVLYRRILSRSPGEPRARVGLANLSAWDGEPAKALRSYDSVLALAPDHQGALRGRGGALNQLGRHREAARVLERALALAPHDAAAAGELARAELGSGRYRAARVRFEGRVDPALLDVADSAIRATASAAEVSGLVRRRKDQLDLGRVTARTTGSIGSLKLYGEYDRSELRDGAAGFRSEGYGGGVRVDRRRLGILAGGRLRTVQGLGSNQWDGFIGLRWRIANAVSIAAGAARSPVEESRRTVQGELEGGELRGAVHANLAHATLAITDLPGQLDVEATVLAGRYTALGLESNPRVSLDARAGVVVHRSQPWVRIGYGFAATRFEYNADPAFTEIPSHRGTYFSPADYWRHQAILQLSQRFGSRVHWEADARMGREWVRQLDGATAASRNTAVANTALTVRLGPVLDLQTRLLYVNAFDAFEMKELTTLLKVYFR
jgi:tetratricopeptide (TPR) repeat protein